MPSGRDEVKIMDELDAAAKEGLKGLEKVKISMSTEALDADRGLRPRIY